MATNPQLRSRPASPGGLTDPRFNFAGTAHGTGSAGSRDTGRHLQARPLGISEDQYRQQLLGHHGYALADQGSKEHAVAQLRQDYEVMRQTWERKEQQLQSELERKSTDLQQKSQKLEERDREVQNLHRQNTTKDTQLRAKEDEIRALKQQLAEARASSEPAPVAPSRQRGSGLQGQLPTAASGLQGLANRAESGQTSMANTSWLVRNDVLGASAVAVPGLERFSAGHADAALETYRVHRLCRAAHIQVFQNAYDQTKVVFTLFDDFYSTAIFKVNTQQSFTHTWKVESLYASENGKLLAQNGWVAKKWNNVDDTLEPQNVFPPPSSSNGTSSVRTSSKKSAEAKARDAYIVIEKALPVNALHSRRSAQINTLARGERIELVEISEKLDDDRVRARIAQPPGWISVRMASGKPEFIQAESQALVTLAGLQAEEKERSARERDVLAKRPSRSRPPTADRVHASPTAPIHFTSALGHIPTYRQPAKDQPTFPDPRQPGSVPQPQCVVRAFYYPGREEPCDKLCEVPFLGNFWPSPLKLEAPCRPGEVFTFTNAEAAFQATKFWKIAHVFENLDGDGAFKERKIRNSEADMSYGGFRTNWEAMLAVLKAKFTPSSALATQLMETGDDYLLEHNSVQGRDQTWSDNADGTGQNWLGLTLMIMRDILTGKNEQPGSWTKFYINTDTMKPKQDMNVSWSGAVRRANAALMSKLQSQNRSSTSRSQTTGPAIRHDQKGANICKLPGCNKPTYDGQPGYCTQTHRLQGQSPPTAPVGHGFVCQLPGCNKPTWDGQPGYCTRTHKAQGEARASSVPRYL